MVLCESIPTLGGPPVPDEEEPDADAMWNDEADWAAEQMAMQMEEEETDGKSVEEQDADWHIRQQKRLAGWPASEADKKTS